MRHRDDDVQLDLIVRRYGIKGLPGWTDEHEAELRRANDLWNRLVEIDRQANTDFAAVTADHPLERGAQAAVDALRKSRDELLGERANERRETRSRSYSPKVRAELRQISRDISNAVVELRRVQKQLRALDDNAKRIEQIEQNRRVAVKLAVHESNVYWATAEAIRKGYETARSAVLKTRGRGLPAQLHFHRYKGGRFVNQFTSGGKSLAKFQNDHRDRDLLVLTGYAVYPPGRISSTRTRKGNTETVMRRPPGGKTFPVTARINEHREIPDIEGLRIKEATIALERWPDWHKLMPAYRSPWLARESRVIITATAPAGSTLVDLPGKEILTVNLGWRKMDSGDLRIATVIGQDGKPILDWPTFSPDGNPIREPLHLLSRDRLLLAERVEQMRSERDLLLEKITVRVRALPWQEAPPENIREWGGGLVRAPKFGHRALARLVIEWQIQCPDWLPDDLAALEEWRKADNALRSNEDAARRKFVGGRIDQYRRLAKAIAERATVILLDQVDYAQMRRKKRVDDDPLEPAARRQGQIAAVGELAQWIRNAARRYGREIIEDAGPSTFVCSNCGHRNEPEHPERLDFDCERCGVGHDQDVNNCRVRLARHLGTSPEPPERLAAAE